MFCGYPEIDGDNLYNAQQVINPQGDFVKNYRKHFLYETDKTWASEGAAFDTLDLKLPRSDTIIKIGHGICMDINPWEFKASYEAYEFATFMRDQKVQLIIFSSAWVSAESYKSD